MWHLSRKNKYKNNYKQVRGLIQTLFLVTSSLCSFWQVPCNFNKALYQREQSTRNDVLPGNQTTLQQTCPRTHSIALIWKWCPPLAPCFHVNFNN